MKMLLDLEDLKGREIENIGVDNNNIVILTKDKYLMIINGSSNGIYVYNVNDVNELYRKEKSFRSFLVKHNLITDDEYRRAEELRLKYFKE